MSAKERKEYYLSGNKLPLGKQASEGIRLKTLEKLFGATEKVVLFSCLNNEKIQNQKVGETELDDLVISILEKAGFEVIFPESLKPLCCGMPFYKGYKHKASKNQVNLKLHWLRQVKMENTQFCVEEFSMYKNDDGVFTSQFKVYDPIEFIHDVLLDRYSIKQINEPIVIHAICSTRKMG